MKYFIIFSIIMSLLFSSMALVYGQEENTAEIEEKNTAEMEDENTAEVEDENTQETAVETEDDSDPFPAGTGELYVYFQYGDDRDFPTSHFGGHYGFAHFIKDGLSFNGEIGGLVILQSDHGGDNAAGVNCNVLMRWHFIRYHRFSIYIDGGAGIIATTAPVPPGTRKWNFTPQAGVGATIKISDDNRIIFGFRYHHISNLGEYNNRGRDAFIGYFGVTWPW